MEISALFERVVVGVDADGVAAEAVIRAHEFSRRFGSEVECLHAVELPRTVWLGLSKEQQGDVHEAILGSARKRTIEELGRALKEHGHIGVDLESWLRVEAGHPAKALVSRSQESGATLVVLGPHRKRRPLDLGSTFRAVLPHATTPVWIQVGRAAPVKRILVGVDLSQHSAHTLGVASLLAESLDASLTALHCYSPPDLYAFGGPAHMLERDREGARKELEGLVREHRGVARVEGEFLEGDALDELRSRLEDVDLIVVGARGRTSLSRFLLGSVAHNSLRESTVPVLVVPGRGYVGQLDETRLAASRELPATHLSPIGPDLAF